MVGAVAVHLVSPGAPDGGVEGVHDAELVEKVWGDEQLIDFVTDPG